MSQFRPGVVWTEREGDIPSTPQNEGDWEACVTTSYAKGLLYGGVIMPAPYTQAERERLEVSPDNPQDLTTTDGKALAVYGRKLRGPSVTSSRAAFLARPGMGYCLTGTGSPVGAQAGTFTHEVFAVCQADGVTVRVYDPLLAAGAAPRDRTVAQIASWMKGIGPNDVREVRKDELVADVFVFVDRFRGPDGTPAPRPITFKPGMAVTGYALDGSTEKFTAGAAGSTAPSDGRATIVRPSGDTRDPKGAGWIRITAGALADHPFIMEAQAGITVPPDPPPAGGFTQADLDAAAAEAAKAQDDAWADSSVAALRPK